MSQINLSELITKNFLEEKPYKSATTSSFTAGPFDNITPCQINDLRKELGEVNIEDILTANIDDIELEEVNPNKRSYKVTVTYSWKLSLKDKMKLKMKK